MRNFLRLAVAAMVLVIMSGSAVYAAPPYYGTVKCNTWMHTSTLPNYTYSVTPVPEIIELNSGSLISLARGSILTISGTGIELEIRAITEFDYSDMGEHTISDPIFTGTTYKFNEPGQYVVYFKQGEMYDRSWDVEVN